MSTVEIVFALDHNDVAALAEVGVVLTTPKATVSQWFGNDRPGVVLHLDHNRVLAGLVDTLDEPTDVLRGLVIQAGGISGRRREKR